MKRLAVIPSDPLSDYVAQGMSSYLESYYNPGKWFDEVYLLSPLEHEERHEFGMHIIPTRDRQLCRRIKDLHVDIVRAYGGKWSCDMACNYKVPGVPVVVSVHDIRPSFLHKSIRKADVVFSVAPEVTKLVLTRFKRPDRVWHLPNRVDFAVMRPLPEEAYADLTRTYPYKYPILQVGRKSQEKNLDTLIKALALLSGDYCLLAIGRGDSGQYVDLAQRLGVSKRCFFIESVRNQDLPLYYSFAACLCNPSRSEAMSFALIEALACGTAVVTSRKAGSGVYLEHLNGGLLLDDPENVEVLAKFITLACTDTELRMRMKQQARLCAGPFEKSRVDQLETDYYSKVLTMQHNQEIRMPLWHRMVQEVRQGLGRR